MASSVFEDYDKTIKRNASEVEKGIHSRKDTYYCLEPSCPAEMIFVAKSNERCAYFRSRSVDKHTCCLCRLKAYDKNKEFEENFSFIVFTNGLKTAAPSRSKSPSTSINKAAASKMPAYTLKNVCEMLKHYDSEDEHLGVPIWRMLLDERSIAHYADSADIHQRNIIVEAKVGSKMFYDAAKHTIKLERKYGTRTLCFILYAANESTFKSITKKIFAFEKNKKAENNRENKTKTEFRNHYAFVSATWFYEKTEQLQNEETIEYYCATIRNAKQFYVA